MKKKKKAPPKSIHECIHTALLSGLSKDFRMRVQKGTKKPKQTTTKATKVVNEIKHKAKPNALRP